MNELNKHPDSEWTVVENRKKKFKGDQHTVPAIKTAIKHIPKKNEPCVYYNTKGCFKKDGSVKSDAECEYMHVLLSPEDMAKLKHIASRRPCYKHNLEKYCRWGDECKYSHRKLTDKEWEFYYGNEPYDNLPVLKNTPTAQETPLQVPNTPKQEPILDNSKNLETSVPSILSVSSVPSTVSISSPDSSVSSYKSVTFDETTQLNILARIADIEKRLVLLDYNIKYSDNYFENRFLLLKSVIMNQNANIHELLKRN